MIGFKLRKIVVLVVFFIDCTLHGAIVFGWSSIDQIIKKEQYFTESNDVNSTTVDPLQARISGQIFVLCVGKACKRLTELLHGYLPFDFCLKSDIRHTRNIAYLPWLHSRLCLVWFGPNSAFLTANTFISFDCTGNAYQC